jgi:BCD family chlorophyll transporter-like MFS transporter
MKRSPVIALWTRVGVRFLPFADAASAELPLARLMRLSLFQVSVGMALALLAGTLNRVMIVELGVAAWLVSAMIALPIVFAPLRALIGHRSDHHRSALGWKRVPYIWFGSLMQFGGLAIMPFALLVLSGDGVGPAWIGTVGAALAFLLMGAGLHTTQTAGLALATDLAAPAQRPRVVALLYVSLLLGMVASGLVLGWLLADFSPLRLIQVVQGAAVVTMVLNGIALWKQEPRARTLPKGTPQPGLRDAWSRLADRARARRLLWATALGTAGFAMQDVLLEPYGGQILNLPVGRTSMLTSLTALGSLVAFAIAARALQTGHQAMRLAGIGALVGAWAFAAVVFSEPLGSPALFGVGAGLIGLGGGLFAVGTLTEAMTFEGRGGDVDAGASCSSSGSSHGLALGAWGAAQATAAGAAIFAGGAIRDGVSALAVSGWLGPAMSQPAVGYSVVYHLEIALLFAALVALGPLVRPRAAAGVDHASSSSRARFGVAEFPG